MPKAKSTGPRTVRGVPCEAFRISGGYLRPFTVYVDKATSYCYYVKHTEAGQALLKNAYQERIWVAEAIAGAAAGLNPSSFVGV